MDRNGEYTEVRFPRENKSRENVEACLQAFRHEADVLEAVRDVPYIARLKDRFEENGTEYIILTMIQGQDLSAYTKKRGEKLPAAEVLSMFQNIFDTLAELHSRGFIHRDISPGNLMRSEDNMLYLIDFGTAASFNGKDVFQSKQVFRHKGLEAPEYSQPGKQGPWTDIFSLCATIVYLIIGEGIAEAGERQNYDYLPQLLMRSALSSRQQNALMKGLEPEIGRRFIEIEQLQAELYGKALTGEDFPEEWHVKYHAKTYIGSFPPVSQSNLPDQ